MYSNKKEIKRYTYFVTLYCSVAFNRMQTFKNNKKCYKLQFNSKENEFYVTYTVFNARVQFQI